MCRCIIRVWLFIVSRGSSMLICIGLLEVMLISSCLFSVVVVGLVGISSFLKWC